MNFDLGDFDTEKWLGNASLPSLVPAIGQSGVYAILLAPSRSLPVITVGENGLPYVGMTNPTLEARSHFRPAHSGFSTLRRTLGALLTDELGLKPIPRGPGSSASNYRNYRFPNPGERALSAWMDQHLLVTQAAVAENVDWLEEALNRLLEPPLNLTGWPNPQCKALKALRANCVAQARYDLG